MKIRLESALLGFLLASAALAQSVPDTQPTTSPAIDRDDRGVPRSHGTLPKIGRAAVKIGHGYRKATGEVERVTGLEKLDRTLSESDWAREHPRLATALRTAKAAGTGFLFSGLNPVGAIVAGGRYALLEDRQDPLHRALADSAAGRYFERHKNAAIYASAATGSLLGVATGGNPVVGAITQAGRTASDQVEVSAQPGDPAKLAEARAYHPGPVDPARMDPEDRRDYEIALRFAPVLLESVNADSAALDTPVDPFRPGESNLLYDVKETEDHVFITYVRFYPGDIKRFGVGNHANDSEGLTVAVQKDGTPTGGIPVGVITAAHREFFASDLTRGKRLVEGERVVVRAEAGSHGTYAVNAKDGGALAKLAGALDLRGQVRSRVLAEPSDRVVRYAPGDPAAPAAGGAGTYGLRPLTSTELTALDALFAGTDGNGADTPAQWSDRGRHIGPGALFEDPDPVFRRLLHWGPAPVKIAETSK